MTGSESRSTVLVFAPHFAPGYRAGGTLRSVVNTIDSVSVSVLCHVITSDRDLAMDSPYPGLSDRVVARGSHTVSYVSSGNIWHVLREVKRWTPASWDAVYINTLWNVRWGILPATLVRMRVLRTRIMLVAPRGQLSEGAMARSGWRKRAAIRLWRILLSRQGMLHASVPEEASECARAFPGVPCLTSLDPVDLGDHASEPHGSEGPLRLVYLSRITPKKNLLAGLEALALTTSPINLTVVGPVDDWRYWQSCTEVMGTLPPSVNVEIKSAVPADAVRRVLEEADALLLPTLGENFGHVIAESLAASCPVVCGPDTPWTSILRNGAGSVVDPTDWAAMADTLERLARTDVLTRRSASAAAGRAFENWIRHRDKQNALDLVVSIRGSGSPVR